MEEESVYKSLWKDKEQRAYNCNSRMAVILFMMVVLVCIDDGGVYATLPGRSNTYLRARSARKDSGPGMPMKSGESGISGSEEAEDDTPIYLQGNDSSIETRSSSMPLNDALKLIQTQNLRDCIARTICTLSCDLEPWGEKGRSAAEMLKGFSSVEPDKEFASDIEYYKNAKTVGEGFKSGHKCSQCKKSYECKKSIKTLLNMLNNVKIVY